MEHANKYIKKNTHIRTYIHTNIYTHTIFSLPQQSQWARQSPLSITHRHTQSVGLLWTGDQLDTGTST
jgi:hypothetical protein